MKAATSARKTAPLDTGRLFEVSMELADKIDYADASLERVARAAKIPVARLRAQYVDFTHYVIALQQQFLDQLRDEVIVATAQHPPGLERVRAATLVYLDHCLKHHGLRAWLVHARREQPLLAEGMRRQNHSFALVISTEFHVLKWPHPLAAARLYLAAIQEAARLEQNKGEPLPYVREAIWDIARFYTSAVSPRAAV
jgi:TetR/AcrR family transcriptional repressor of nem operon